MRQFIMKFKMIIFYIILKSFCYAQENTDIAQQSQRLSIKYTKGNILLYDCDDKHWVCTDMLEQKNCLERREQITLDKDQFYPCVVYKTYKVYDDCIKDQQRLTDHAIQVLFCHNGNYVN